MITLKTYSFWREGQRKYNYVYSGSLDLSSHVISDPVPKGKRTLVFLGTSSMAGDNVPLNTTISDQFNRLVPSWSSFNLAKPQSDMAVVAIYFQLAFRYLTPDLAVVGVSPALTPTWIATNEVVAYHRKLLADVVPASTFAALQKRISSKGLFFLPLRAWLGPDRPTAFRLAVATEVHRWKKWLYGDLYSKDIYAFKERSALYDLSEKNQNLKLFDGLIDMAKAKGTEIAFYFEPFLKDDSFDSAKHRNYRKKVAEILDRRGVRYFDYSDLLPSSSRYFLDYIHPTPEGNEWIAKKVAGDLGLTGD